MLTIDYSKCDNCCTCISVCPVNALIYKEKLTIDPEVCILCGKCVKVCPFAALSIQKKEKGKSNE